MFLCMLELTNYEVRLSPCIILIEFDLCCSKTSQDIVSLRLVQFDYNSVNATVQLDIFDVCIYADVAIHLLFLACVYQLFAHQLFYRTSNFTAFFTQIRQMECVRTPCWEKPKHSNSGYENFVSQFWTRYADHKGLLHLKLSNLHILIVDLSKRLVLQSIDFILCPGQEELHLWLFKACDCFVLYIAEILFAPDQARREKIRKVLPDAFAVVFHVWMVDI